MARGRSSDRATSERLLAELPEMQVLGLLRGRLTIVHGETTLALKAGDFCLLPACLGRVTLTAEMQTEFLHVQPG